jgi:hypothetical protein
VQKSKSHQDSRKHGGEKSESWQQLGSATVTTLACKTTKTTAQSSSMPEVVDLLSSSDDDDETEAAPPPSKRRRGAPAAGPGADARAGAPIVIDLTSLPQEAAAAEDDNRQLDRDAAMAQALQDSFDAEFDNGEEDEDIVADHGEQLRRRRQATGSDATAAAAATDRDVCWKQRRDVHSFLKRAATQLTVEKIETNDASLPGQPLYNRFKAAYESLRDKRIRMVFHGTPQQNAAAIAEQGLDPKRRAGQAMGPGEYFGTDANTSLGYCQGGDKMLVFAVLLDRSGLTAASGGGLQPVTQGQQAPAYVDPGAYRRMAPKAPKWISANGDVIGDGVMVEEASKPVGPGVVVVHKPDHQLPLFVIHFRVNRQNPFHGAAMGAAVAPLPPAMTGQQMHQALMGFNSVSGALAGGVQVAGPAWGRAPWQQPPLAAAAAAAVAAAASGGGGGGAAARPFAGLGRGNTLGGTSSSATDRAARLRTLGQQHRGRRAGGY